MILFRRKLFFPLRCPAAQDSTVFSYFYSPSPFISASSSVAENPHAKSLLIIDYLIKTVGLSSEKAIKLSKSLTHVKFFSKADAVLRFFKESGFSDANIKRIVSKNRRVLTAKVDTTLKPKLTALKELGFSESEVQKIVITDPIILFHSRFHSKIMFWRRFLGSNARLLYALIRGRGLINLNLDTNVMPKISFLRDIGYSDNQIACLITKNPSFIASNLDSIKALSKRAEEMGFSYGSSAFLFGVASLSHISTKTFNSKLKLLSSFGWPEDEIFSTIRKFPKLLLVSEKKMKVVITFFTNQAEYDPSYVMKHPNVLTCSMARMIARNHVIQLLRKNALLKRNLISHSFMHRSDKCFVEKYIKPYQEEMPELHQVYITLCAGHSTLV